MAIVSGKAIVACIRAKRSPVQDLANVLSTKVVSDFIDNTFEAWWSLHVRGGIEVYVDSPAFSISRTFGSTSWCMELNSMKVKMK